MGGRICLPLNSLEATFSPFDLFLTCLEHHAKRLGQLAGGVLIEHMERLDHEGASLALRQGRAR